MTARRLIIPLAVIAAVLTAAYLSLPAWAPRALRLVLPPEITVEQLVLRRPGWHALTIDRLALTYTTGAWRAHAIITDLNLNYRWHSLRRRQLDAVRAAALDLAVQQRTATTASAPNRPPMAVPTPAELLARLPAARIELPAITLQTPAPDRIRQWSGSAHFATATLALDLTSATTPRLDLSLRADRENQLDLVLQREGKNVATLHNYIATARTLRGSLELQLAPLAALAQEWGSLPDTALRGTTTLSWSGPLPSEWADSSWRSLTLRGTAAADISADRDGSAGRLSARADYELSQGGLALTFKTLRADGAIAVPAAARALLPRQASLPFTGRLAAGTEARLTLQPLQVALRGTAAFAFGTPPQGASPPALQIALSLDDPELSLSDAAPQLRTRFALDARLAQWRHAPYRLQQLRAQIGGALAGSPQQGTLQLPAGAEWLVQRVHGPDLAVAPLRTRTQQPLTLRWRAHKLEVASAQLQLDGSTIERADQRYRFKQASAALRDLQFDLDAPLAASARASLQFDGLTVPLGPYRTQALAVNTDLTLAQAALRGRWKLSTPVAGLALSGDFRHSLKTGNGKLTATLPPFTFQESGRYLPALLENWPYPFGLSGGRLGLDAELTWGRALKASARIEAQELAGFYNLNLFKGLSAKSTVTYADGALTVAPTRVALADLDVGFPVQQLLCEVSARLPDTLLVSDLRANLLGGTFNQSELRYRRQDKETRATWRFADIHLAQLVALEQNVEGDGVLDGELPVVLSAAGVAVAGGELHARAPGGVIRYRGELPQSTLTAVPALQLALDSLRNFHYRTLAARADYAPTGDLNLGIGLLGRNPDLDEPRPVQLNLTIRENIPELLRSLQLSRDIGDKIEQRIQEFYRLHQQEMSP